VESPRKVAPRDEDEPPNPSTFTSGVSPSAVSALVLLPAVSAMPPTPAVSEPREMRWPALLRVPSPLAAPPRSMAASASVSFHPAAARIASGCRLEKIPEGGTGEERWSTRRWSYLMGGGGEGRRAAGGLPREGVVPLQPHASSLAGVPTGTLGSARWRVHQASEPNLMDSRKTVTSAPRLTQSSSSSLTSTPTLPQPEPYPNPTLPQPHCYPTLAPPLPHPDPTLIPLCCMSDAHQTSKNVMRRRASLCMCGVSLKSRGGRRICVSMVRGVSLREVGAWGGVGMCVSAWDGVGWEREWSKKR
jgi:hypothetical protein